jgi:micrococcal nuclease
LPIDDEADSGFTRPMKKIQKQLKYLLPVLILVLIAGLVLSRVYQPDPSHSEPEVQINAVEADDYIGTVARVCGEVASTDYLPQVNGKPTFLNLGRAYPNQFLTAVIWGDDRAKWTGPPPEQRYSNRKICVSGMIETYEGTPQIIVNRPDQITIEDIRN